MIHVYELRLTPIRTLAPHEVASCEPDSLAFTLTTLREEGQIDDDSRIGILARPSDHDTGTWLINPYAKGPR